MTALDVLDRISIGTPITRGPITLFPVYLHGEPAAAYLAGPVAAEQGVVEVDEEAGGQVPTLNTVNKSELPVLMLEGETFVGGLQNRMLNVSVLIAPGRAQVPVSCVEAGRWGRRSKMERSDFMASRRLRREANYSVSMAVRRGDGKRSDQGRIWDQVSRTLDSRDVKSESVAFHDTFEMAAVDDGGRAVNELIRLGPLPGQHGMVVASGGRILSADVFDKPETLAAYWSALLSSHRFDLPEGLVRRPTTGSALRFVRRLARHSGAGVPGVGLGVEHRITTDKAVGTGLVWDDHLVHLSAYAA